MTTKWHARIVFKEDGIKKQHDIDFTRFEELDEVLNGSRYPNEAILTFTLKYTSEDN
jgi:hypothetical protein